MYLNLDLLYNIHDYYSLLLNITYFRKGHKIFAYNEKTQRGYRNVEISLDMYFIIDFKKPYRGIPNSSTEFCFDSRRIGKQFSLIKTKNKMNLGGTWHPTDRFVIPEEIVLFLNGKKEIEDFKINFMY